ncbi:MAG: beta-ketoacyl-ACP synthase [Myxococcaceae bacterium]|nr:beta-ketoacyl-ACP synthase [Myxococcaceae bacterium]
MSPKRRVVITGFGALTPIGNDADGIVASLRGGRSGIRAMPQWAEWKDLHTRVGGVVDGFDEKSIPREFRRSMSRMACLAAEATRRALESSRLPAETLSSGRAGISLGQTVAAPSPTQVYFDTLRAEGVRALKSTTFFQMMGHSAAANTALMFGCKGRVWAPNAACASSSQAIGQGFETIAAGQQDVMLCGGSEELHATTAITFDIVQGTSRAFNASPTQTPRPFDRARDGLVVAEGAGVVVLEALDHAVKRGAPVLGEVLGFATTCDGEHMSQPSKAGMAKTMALALEGAGLAARDIGYVNAHATATPTGDGVEAQATLDVLGAGVPVSSTKGHTGHTLAACGAIEVIFSLLMMQRGFLAPTLNLSDVADDCRGPNLLREPLEQRVTRVLSNNFAFGGVNTSLVLSAPA